MSAPLDVDGPAAPPRANGELVFAEPWESRAWLAALEDVLADSDTVHADDVTTRAHTLAQRPTGHDHPHPH